MMPGGGREPGHGVVGPAVRRAGVVPSAPGGFGTFATPAIPPAWFGKILFQSLAFGGSGLELSTPCLIDAQ